MIDFDVIFPMQSSECTESLNLGFWSIAKKNATKYLQIDFIDKKEIFEIPRVYSDRSEL